MGIMDVLGRYAQSHDRAAPQVMDDFDQVSQHAPREMVSAGLADAFRSDATPPFEQMVGSLFGRSDPHQRAGLLSEIFGRRVSPDEAQEVPPGDVEAATRDAARSDPGIIERVSRFYAQHPQLVQGLGQAAIAIAMSSMARRRNTL